MTYIVRIARDRRNKNMTEKPQNKNLDGLSTKNDSYEEHADKCSVCGSVHLSGSSETGIACDDCGYEEQE